MKNRLSLQDYRRIDLLIFAGLLIIFEFIIINAASKWFPYQPFTVSLAAAITSIVYMRWGLWGGFIAALSGFVFALFYEGTLDQYIVYIAGNLCSLPAAFVLIKAGKERIQKDASLSLIYAAAVLFLMQTGRAIVSLLLGAGMGDAVRFYTTDSLSYVFTLVIVWIARRLDGVFEDQKHYIIRLNEQENEHDDWGHGSLPWGG